MKYTLHSEAFLIEGPPDTLKEIYEELSFKNKKVQYEIAKFRALKKKIPLKSSVFEKRISELKAEEIVRVAEFKGDKLWVPIGLFPRVHGKFPGDVLDLRNHRLSKKLMRSSNKKLRRPQEEALTEIGNLHPLSTFGLIEMATGVGKTRLAEELIALYGLKTVFLVPSRNLMRSTAERFKDIFGKFEVGMYGDGKKEVRQITVATYQSVNLADPEDFKDVNMVVMDEAHHVPAQTFYNAAIVNLKNAIYRFGLSATPDRADGADLLVEAACGQNIYSYSAKRGIDEGYLARPEFLMYAVQTTRGVYKKWKTENGKRVFKGLKYADVSDKKADTDALTAYKNWIVGNDILNDCVAALARDCASMGKCVLILVDEKEHGEKLSERLHDIKHEFVHGDRSDVEEVVEKYNRREIPILIGTTVIGEGTDTIPVDVMFNLLGNTRPQQAIGRALRNDGGKKPKCLIIDFFFPNCKVLNRHAELRQKVYEEYGNVERETLV